MRIVAGTARGRVLATPKGADVIRPTSDRARETLFNVLGQTCEGLTVLDLYAGTGALGLEALSRGAVRAVLVDSGREALELCRNNAQALGFSEQVEIVAASAERALERLAGSGARFDLVFSDPPYRLRAGLATLTQVEPLLAPGARVVVEHERQEPLPQTVGGLAWLDERRFGDTVVAIFRLTGAPRVTEGAR